MPSRVFYFWGLMLSIGLVNQVFTREKDLRMASLYAVG